MFAEFLYRTQGFLNLLITLVLRGPVAVFTMFGLQTLFPEFGLGFAVVGAMILTYISGLGIGFVVVKGDENMDKKIEEFLNK